jgi:hypothetical protein
MGRRVMPGVMWLHSTYKGCLIHMESIYRDLIIGTIGSIFGALIVYFGSYGLNLTKRARRKSAVRTEREKSLWKTRKIQVRMEITNNYLFVILKDFLIGSILTVAPSMIASLTISFLPSDLLDISFLYLPVAGITLLGITYYFFALGKALRYLRIRREDEDYLDTYLSEEKKGDTP